MFLLRVDWSTFLLPRLYESRFNMIAPTAISRQLIGIKTHITLPANICRAVASLLHTICLTISVLRAKEVIARKKQVVQMKIIRNARDTVLIVNSKLLKNRIFTINTLSTVIRKKQVLSNFVIVFFFDYFRCVFNDSC